MQYDATTQAALEAFTTRQGWCEALLSSLGAGYKVVWRDALDNALVTATMSGLAPVVNRQIAVSAQPASVVCAAGTPTKMRLESADGSRWVEVDTPMKLVNGAGAVIEPVVGAGFRWDDTLTVSPPISDPPLPTWLDGQAVLTYIELSNTSMTATLGTHVGIMSYSGGKIVYGEMVITGGGHADYSGNEIVGINLRSNTPTWYTRSAATPAEQRLGTAESTGYNLDGKPTARHTYWSIQHDAESQRLLLIGNYGSGNPPTQRPRVDAFNLSTNTHYPEGTLPDIPDSAITSAVPVAMDDRRRIWYFCTSGGGALLKYFDCATNTWTNCGTPTGSVEASIPMCFDPTRRRLFRTSLLNSPNGQLLELEGYSGTGMPTQVTVTYTGPSAAEIGATGQSMVYCPDLDAFIVLQWEDRNFTMHKIDAETFYCEPFTVAGTPPTLPTTIDANQRYYGRFAYVPELRGCVIVPRADGNVFFFRTA